jgi:hypothetical protein
MSMRDASVVGSGRSRHQHEAALLGGEGADHGGQAQRLERLDLVRNHPEHRSERVSLLVDVDAEAGLTYQGEREVEFESHLEDLALLLRQHGIERTLNSFRQLPLKALKGQEFAVDPNRRRSTGRNVKVGSPESEHRA